MQSFVHYQLQHTSLQYVVTDRKTDNTIVSSVEILCRNITSSINDPRIEYSMEGLKVGDMIHFECQAGYVVNGSVHLECNDDGQWVGTIPVCNGESW